MSKFLEFIIPTRLPPPRATVYLSLPAVPCKLLRKGHVLRASSSVKEGDAVAGLYWNGVFEHHRRLICRRLRLLLRRSIIRLGGQYGAFDASTFKMLTAK